MVKTLTLIKHKPGMSQADFIKYYEDGRYDSRDSGIGGAEP
ncbi:MAG: hypothetical protein NTU41_09005 [Chloroflexi bacterium]|nr:hypothetical protein [Chloroflexota bacterium]